jgi:hypothetical protein
MSILGFCLPPDSGEKIGLGKLNLQILNFIRNNTFMLYFE